MHARSIRIEYAGAAYHVITRGNQGRDIYAADRDRKLWLEALGEARKKPGWRIHACVLMGNHYHPLTVNESAGLKSNSSFLPAPLHGPAVGAQFDLGRAYLAHGEAA